MEKEEIHLFETRLSQWISTQGFWFQLRYALFGRGSFATVSYHLMQMMFRVLVFLVIVAGGTGYYFFKRTGKQVFLDELTAASCKALGAEEAKIDGFRRVQGEMRINRFGAVGSQDSFFKTLDVGTIHCTMGLMDGMTGKWDAGPVSARTCLLEVKAGADDAETTRRAADALFRTYPKFSFPSIEIAEASVRWGYSDRTWGGIEKSHLLAHRTDTGWRLQFRGGNFTQNWLHQLEIDELLINVDRNGLTVEKGEFHRGSGKVSLRNVTIAGGERPQIHGTAKIKNLPLDAILPPISSGFIEGTISADLALSGSTNSTEGIGFQGQVLFDGTDVLTLRERVHLLRALSVVDVFNSYRKIDFREGSFTLRTTSGVLDITDVDLKAKNLFTMQGRMQVRHMTEEEIAAQIQSASSAGGSPIFDRQEGGTDKTSVRSAEDDFTLKKAAKEEKKENASPDAIPAAPTLFDRMAQMNLSHDMAQQEKNRLSRQLRFDGGFRVTIPADSFERAQQLREDFPVDPTTGRIPINVPVQGTLYDITLKQAEEIYQKGRRQD
jgi:hypothetical protein